LDDWRFTRRMPSRAAAVRELLRRGLAAEGVGLTSRRMRSKDYRVTGGSRPREGNGHDQSGAGDGADA
jgi:hypothetical protein